MPATAGASEPASTYNADGQIHADRCMEPKTTDIRLRYLDASPTGFAIPNPLSFTDGSCPDGQLRIDLHEVVDSPAGPLVFSQSDSEATHRNRARCSSWTLLLSQGDGDESSVEAAGDVAFEGAHGVAGGSCLR
ncbi:MAG: hypothetical protein ACJ76R_11385 [Solirubrobacteraceae bacterium]